MLVLSRKVGQTIQIGDNITITVTQVNGKNIRIGIDAPAEVPIRRGELRATPTAITGVCQGIESIEIPV